MEEKRMSYRTENEAEHFDFEDAVITGIDKGLSSFHLYADNVKIRPENSTNRDIRMMRTNGLKLTITSAVITRFVDEGYTVFDADGKERMKVPDRDIPEKNWEQAFQNMNAMAMDGLEKKENTYILYIRTEDHTARMEVQGDGDTEEWDRYLNL